MKLAEFKRKAKDGTVFLEMIERYGETGDAIPERLRGVRKIVGVNSVGISLLNHNGKTSELRISSAKLFDCDGDTLTIYESGEREPTAEEKSVKDEWERIEKEYYEKNPFGCNSFWFKKDFFSKSAFPYMSGFDSVRGKRYQSHNGLIRDNKVRGKAILKYRVCYE